MRKRIGAVTAIMVLTAFSAHAAYAATSVEPFSLLSALESFASDVVTGVEHIAEAIGQNIAALSGNGPINTVSYTASVAASQPPTQDIATTQPQPSAPATTTVTEIIIQREQPIIETVSPSTDTITKGELSSLLAGLTNVLSLLPTAIAPSSNIESQIAALQSAISSQTYSASAAPFLGGGSPNTIAAANAIDQLSGTTISSPTITGGTIANTSLSGGPISATSLSVSGASSFSGALSVGGNLTAGSISFSAASSTGITVIDATTTNLVATNATSTNLFATLGNFTSAIANTLNASVANIVGFSATNGTTTDATSTNLFSTSASSTNLFAETASVGSLVANSLALNSPLAVGSGGTNAISYSSGQLLSYNGTSFVSTSTIGNNQLANSAISGVSLGGTLNALSANSSLIGTSYDGSASVSNWGINLSNANSWTGLQTFANASSTVLSNFGTAYFGGTATSTFDSAGDLSIGGTLSATQGGSLGGTFAGTPTLSGAVTFSGTPVFSSGFLISPTGSTASPAPNQAGIDARASMSVEDFGAKCDTFVSNTMGTYFNPSGSITSGSTLFTSTSGVFSTASVGNSISIAGAGPSGAVLGTTIASYVSPTQVNLATSASSTISDTNFSFGTNDTAAIQAAINWAASSRLSRRLLVPPGAVCGVTSTVTIAANNVDIEGSQQSAVGYDTAIGPSPITSGFAWVGGASGTIMTIAPTSGASNPALIGVTLHGLAFAANNLAQVGLDVSGLQNGTFGNLYFQEGTMASLFVHGGNYTLGGYCGVQHNTFTNITAFQYSAPGIPILEEGNSAGTCNPSLNYWQNIGVTHNTQNAIELLGADNEYFVQVSVGTWWGNTPYSVYFGTEGGYHSNTNDFAKFSATRPAYADTGTYDEWFFLDEGNSTPAPEGPGTVHWTDSTGLLNNMQWAPNVGIGSSIFSPAYELDINAPDGTSTGRVRLADQSAAGSGDPGSIPVFETIGARGDSNSSFEGQFAAAFRRTDGTAIATSATIGALAFGGQYGTSTTFQPSQILYPASIQGIAEGSFTSATAMPTGIAFFTGSTGQNIGAPNNSYGTERMRITSSGNIGIGTTSPATNLSVAGSTYTTGGLGVGYLETTPGEVLAASYNLADNSVETITGDWGINLNGDTTHPIQVPNSLLVGYAASGGTYTNGTLLVNGNVGIGTTTPDQKLTVNGAIDDYGANSGLELSGSGSPVGPVASTSVWYMYQNSDQSFNLGRDGYNPVFSIAHDNTFSYRTDGLTALDISTLGNVGIDTTNPGTNWLDIANNGANTTGLKITGYGSGLGYGILLTPANDSSPNVIFFTNAAGTAVGSVTTTNTATAYNTTSDRRLKENIATTTAGLSTLLQIPVDDFNFIRDPSQRVQGFIAQDLEKIYPEAVTTNGDNGIVPLGATSTPWSVDYGRITPLIIKAVQDIANISSTFQQNLIAWLGNADNGITDLFAKNLYAMNVTSQVDTTQELCITNGPNDPTPVCVTKAQLAVLLSKSAAAGLANPSPAAPSTTFLPNPSPSPAATSTTPDTPPVIKINGDNPAIIQVGATYADLGATITGPQTDLNLGLKTFLNGALVSSIVLDTTTTATDTINYVVTDSQGLTSTSTRAVVVEQAAHPATPPPPPPSTDGTSTAATSSMAN